MLLVSLRACGALMILLSGLHAFLPGRFRWWEEFRGVSLLSRQMFYVHTAFISLIVLMNGLLFLFLAPDLESPSRLAAAILGAATVFWATRFFVQLFVYSPWLWRKKPFETWMHIAFTALWVVFTITCGVAFNNALG